MDQSEKTLKKTISIRIIINLIRKFLFIHFQSEFLLIQPDCFSSATMKRSDRVPFLPLFRAKDADRIIVTKEPAINAACSFAA